MSKPFGQTGSRMGIGGAHFAQGFRRDDIDRKPGKAIPLGERPEGRPFAAELGNGKSYANITGKASSANGAEAPVRVGGYGERPTDPTYYRKRVGLPLFSWEQR